MTDKHSVKTEAQRYKAAAQKIVQQMAEATRQLGRWVFVMTPHRLKSWSLFFDKLKHNFQEEALPFMWFHIIGKTCDTPTCPIKKNHSD